MRNGLIFPKGTVRMKWERGRASGWHVFQTDARYTVKLDRRTCTTVLVVKSGPDRGTYLQVV
jgi:hypothetical protein